MGDEPRVRPLTGGQLAMLQQALRVDGAALRILGRSRHVTAESLEQRGLASVLHGDWLDGSVVRLTERGRAIASTASIHPPAAETVSEYWERRFWSRAHPEPNSGCWLWTGGVTNYGYGTIGLRVGPPWRRITLNTHRVSWELVHGRIPDGLLVRHACDNPPCINPDHLSLGNQSDNMSDKIARGRFVYNGPRGEASSSAKLTSEDVVTMRWLRRGGESYSSLARRFGVSSQTARSIVLGKKWRHVPHALDADPSGEDSRGE